MLEALARIHYNHYMSAQTIHRILISWLILALLFAQGLRVCIHTYGEPHVAAQVHNAAATHLESTFSMLDDHGGAMSDTHITLIGILKSLTAEPLYAALFITLLFILLTQQRTVWLVQPRDQVFRPPHGHYFSPPLRAPPR